MPWIRIDDHAPEHPKMLRAGASACWLWVCGLAYCSRHLTDGEIPAEALLTLGISKAGDAAGRLVHERLWDEIPGGYRVHDYHDYQPSKAQVSERRKRTIDRVTEWRKRHGYAHGNADVTLLPNECNAVSTHPPVPVPVPDPDPDPVPVPQEPVSHARAIPVAPRMNPSAAFQGRPNVPAFLHVKLRAKLVGPEDACDQRLRDWYCATADAWADRAIGDDDVKFWEARFREWIGTTVKPIDTRPREPTIAELVERDLKAREAKQQQEARR